MGRRTAQQLIDLYLGKVIGFAQLKMANPQDAEDLAQDIMLQLISNLNRGVEVVNLDAYVWKVSCNVLNRTLRRRYGAVYVELTGLEQIEDNTLDLLLSQEEAMLVRREVALLSPAYRSAVVRFYYEGRSVREIAEAGGVSEGTVKWWLFEARRELRKGVEMVRTIGERSIKPERLEFAISGSSGRRREPFSLVQGNLLAQNILLAAYEKPLDEATIAQELGVSRPYVESEVERLVAGELMKKVGSNTFQTDFVISNGEMEREAIEIVERVYGEIRGEIEGFIESLVPELAELATNAAGFTVERVRWIAIPLVMDMLSRVTFQKIIPAVTPIERQDGGRWLALGFASDPDKAADNPRYDENGPIGSSFGDRSYGAWVLFHQFSGLRSDPVGHELTLDNPCKASMVFRECVDLAQGRLDEAALGGVEKEALAEAMSWHLIVREKGMLKLNHLFIPKARLDSIRETSMEFGEHLMAPLREMVEGVNAVVRRHSPEHVWWQIPTFSYSFYHLPPMLLDDYYKEGRLSEPHEEDKHLLSLYIWG